MQSLGRLLTALFVAHGLLACGDDTSGTDGGVDGAVDASPDAQVECNLPPIGWSRVRVATTIGVERSLFLDLQRDYCLPATATLESSDSTIATVPGTVDFAARTSRLAVAVTPVAVGTAIITATIANPGPEEDVVAMFTVEVTTSELPACDGTASGTVTPGTPLTATSGGLTGSAITVPEGAAADNAYHVDAFEASIACAEDIVPEGFTALGPAITFGPTHQQFNREVSLSLPARVSLLPEGGHFGHIEMIYQGLGGEARLIPVSFEKVSDAADAIITFGAPRLGTYQVAYRDGAGVPRDREFSYRGILGVSMGGAGVGSVGFRNPERFDFGAPLGAAWDWTYLADYMYNHHLGGFCTATEFAETPEECNAASTSRTPEPRWLHEIDQDFEHWEYNDDTRGHGTRFDRPSYVRIFRDIAQMFGNPLSNRTDATDEPNITPPGVPDTERMRSNTERCSNPVVIETGYFDDEYNPDGTLPAATFCDGAELTVDGEVDVGVWDPNGAQSIPMEVAVFIDRNSNSVRDAGEPVVRNMREAFEDCGLDRLCNPEEEGFDAVTNPDPAGDDYDYQYNALGTEGNFARDGERCEAAGELFRDFGLDGVESTPQLADGGYDSGEGNGCWDVASGLERMRDRGPREALGRLDENSLRDFNIFADGGIRDLFNFAAAANHTMGALPGRTFPLRYYNGHATMHLDGRTDDDDFVFTDVDWNATGANVLVTYGSPDSSPGLIEAGDGAHVGWGTQAINRLFAPIAWMSQRWPGGDTRVVTDVLCDEGRAGCTNPNQFTIDFTSPTTGRTGPASVILPPGYFHEEYADTTYPVVYFLHGYGQEPEDLLVTGVLLWNFMTASTLSAAQRIKKMIFVFPDGRCRGDECLKGTFYTDAPPEAPGAAQMETFLLDLMDHMDANYRTRDSETHSVID